MKLPNWAGRAWLRDPLTHFLLAGFLVFAFFQLRGEPVDPASRTIEVTREQQAQLAVQWEQTMQRPPTDAELDLLTEQWIREEVLYREALRLGLDVDDAVIRRRLVQKMDFIAASQAETAVASDADLEAWLKAHPERFSSDPRYTLDQLWFEQESSAQAALAQLRGGADWKQLGERISLPPSLADTNRIALAGQFGQDFAKRLDALEPGTQWQGPVPSGFGYHLVRLTSRSAGKVPPLAEIREAVAADWRANTGKERQEEAYQLLRDAYTIKGLK
ncbi:MAG: peptidylprolyl isomerase [Sphingomonadaceae bacterium]|nr:peptidyl-prolyl cis-trans isomerase [Sphingomonadaceae bacterium]